MRQLLIDTNVFLFWTAGGKKLSARARKLIENADHELLFSAVSSWEIAIKFGLGKLALPVPPHKFVPSRIEQHSLTGIAFEHEDALAVADLPDHHDDPFDRALIAQAIVRDVAIITADSRFDDYDVDVEW